MTQLGGPYFNWAQTIGALHDQARRAEWPEADLKTLMNAYDLVEPMFAGWRRASGRPFLCHLTGVASLTLKHGGTRDEVLAALTHAALQAGAYGAFGASAHANVQPVLVRSLPPGCVRLIEAYAMFDWKAFIGAAEHDLASAVSSASPAMLKLRIANETDDALDWPFLTEHRRREGARECAVSVEAANTLGWQSLAQEVLEVRDAMGVIPPASDVGREDYFVQPAGHTLAFPVRLTRKLRRTFSRPGRPA